MYQTYNEHFHRLVTDVMTSIRVKVLTDHQPTEMEQSHPDIHVVALNAELSGPGRGKVHYVAGYVVAKLKYRNSKKLSSKLFAPGQQRETKHLLQRKSFLEQLSALDTQR